MRKCDLCHTPLTKREPSILCQPCQEAIKRLMTIEQWSAGRKADVKANHQQADMLTNYAKQHAYVPQPWGSK